MALQYWVGDFFVDLSRNQITQKEQSQIIAPKALAVLTHLAENQGKVVSYDELFSKVWPDTVVAPNTLQRSIAQLRKALGEDSKIQSCIKTHAKQGYSLECDVKWQNESSAKRELHLNSEQELGAKLDTVTESASVSQSGPSRSTLRLTPVVGMIILTVIALSYFGSNKVGSSLFGSKQPWQLSFDKLRPLTATDNKEIGGIYSPDGQHVVFLRYSERFCINNIWAKNTKTQEEIQLTKNWGTYGSHSFSKDGKKLVYIESQNCTQPITQKKCYKLMSLDFQKALKTPQSPSVLMECKNSKITRTKWLNNNNIALMQEFTSRWKLISYSITDNKSNVIYETENGNFFDYDYSPKDDLIALTSVHNNGQRYIEMLKPDGQLLSSHQIEYPKEITNLRAIYPNFMPQNGQLVFSTGRQLFTLSYEGKITNISLPLDEPMGSPIFHPDGKRMLATKGIYDSDIATVPLSQIAQTETEQVNQNNQYSLLKSSILERSIKAEDNAIFQPTGELIAFKSGRSGEDQLWVTNDSGAKQLSHFPMDNYIYNMSWAADGKSILVNANKELTQIFLDSSQKKTIPFSHPIEQLFQWNSEDNTALLTVRIDGIKKLIEFDLNHSKYKIVTDKKINWALKSEDGRLIYTDHMDRFWQPGPAEDQLIESLKNQGSDKRFVIKDNVIYGINEDFQFWSYALDKETFEIFGAVQKNIDYLTDINQTNILISVRINAKKELAELSLSE